MIKQQVKRSPWKSDIDLTQTGISINNQEVFIEFTIDFAGSFRHKL